MDTRKHMIIVGDKIITRDVRLCMYNQHTDKYDLQFYTGKTYSYSPQNILWMKEPKTLDPKLYHISHVGHTLSRIDAIYVFEGNARDYWHICFDDGNEADYERAQLSVTESCFHDAASSRVFEYLKQTAALSGLRSGDGKKILESQYGKISFVGKNTALAAYLNPKKEYHTCPSPVPIFPFGCSRSQYQAVKAALEHSVSVISGPPGTRKTQAILNIIANILVNGKTVQVVSNNDSAIEDIFERLSAPRYHMGFLAAPLGKSENKKAFIAGQTGVYPDLSPWKQEDGSAAGIEAIKEKSKLLDEVFKRREKLELLRQELAKLELEFKNFEQYSEETGVDLRALKPRGNLSSGQWMQLWQECQDTADREGKLGFWFRLRSFFAYGIPNWSFFHKQNLAQTITAAQGMFYQVKLQELREAIQRAEAETAHPPDCLVDEVCDLSLEYLQNMLYHKYGTKKERKKFTEADLRRNPYDVLEEYPIVLSTASSSRSSLGQDVVYDYVIMDEASQMDVAAGALALSCAKNVVIAGDAKQPPDVMADDVIKRANAVFKSFNIPEGYDFAKYTFLQSVINVIPQTPQTLLREMPLLPASAGVTSIRHPM